MKTIGKLEILIICAIALTLVLGILLSLEMRETEQLNNDLFAARADAVQAWSEVERYRSVIRQMGVLNEVERRIYNDKGGRRDAKDKGGQHGH